MENRIANIDSESSELKSSLENIHGIESRISSAISKLTLEKEKIIFDIRKGKEKEFLSKYGKIKSEGYTLIELCKPRYWGEITEFNREDFDPQFIYYEKILEVDPKFDIVNDTIVCKHDPLHKFDWILCNGNKTLFGAKFHKYTPETSTFLITYMKNI